MNIRRTLLIISVLAGLNLYAQAATNLFAVTTPSFTTTEYTINGEPNPALSLVRGYTYTFDINVSAIHPFYIKTASGVIGSGSTWDDGVSAQGVTVGTITFAVPATAPDTLYYQCGNHSAMTGPLNIQDPPNVNITDFSVDTNVTIQSTGTDVLNLNVLTSSDLTSNAWVNAQIQNNTYSNGTNSTHVAMPAGDAAFFQVEQGFFSP